MLTLALPPALAHSYLPKDNSLQSETVRYKRGVCQQFCLPSHTVDLSEWAEDEVSCHHRTGQAAGRGRGAASALGPGPELVRTMASGTRTAPCSKVMLTFSLVRPAHS